MVAHCPPHTIKGARHSAFRGTTTVSSERQITDQITDKYGASVDYRRGEVDEDLLDRHFISINTLMSCIQFCNVRLCLSIVT